MSEVPQWIRKGCYIDVKDAVNDWCVGMVTDVCTRPNHVAVVKDG